MGGRKEKLVVALCPRTPSLVVLDGVICQILMSGYAHIIHLARSKALALALALVVVQVALVVVQVAKVVVRYSHPL
jgi:hypothetical protein